jgi:eukaryotic-like serine/threonine-protein kinase
VALNPGVRLGPYEVVSALGAGGMGEVYKAHDTRLDRAVAVKVLPSDVAGDADSRARFEREARAVAALDHPHICGIYDVGSVDGTHYLVMPHLEGQTLAARLERGPLPLDQALKIAAEMADALDKAHRQGIVHRDLKPANIMLTKAGPKLLDFGLAKLRPSPGPVSLSEMTRTVPAAPETARGAILGTLHYMAPEQLEGREADARSDIWGLGAVLYEMATGVRPFAGDTPASVIGAILRDTPPAVSTRQRLAPRMLDHLVNRCLAKDPDERWQSIGDVGGMLESIAAHQPANVDPRARRSVWRERSAWIAATILLLIGLAFVTRWARPVVPPTDIVRLSVNPPESASFTLNVNATVPIPQFALSANGRSLAFVAARSALRPTLWLRHLEDVEARSLAGTEDAQDPFWSPDGRWIGFFDGQGTLKRVAVSGGAVQTVTRGTLDPRGASWGPDDTILFGTGYGAVYRVAAAGGTPQPVTRLDSSKGEGSHRWPLFLPDGRHFLFLVRSGLAEHRGVYVGALDDETRHQLLRGLGHRCAVCGSGLFAVPGRRYHARSDVRQRSPASVGPTYTHRGARRPVQPRERGVFSLEDRNNRLSQDVAPTTITVVLNGMAALRR